MTTNNKLSKTEPKREVRRPAATLAAAINVAAAPVPHLKKRAPRGSRPKTDSATPAAQSWVKALGARAAAVAINEDELAALLGYRVALRRQSAPLAGRAHETINAPMKFACRRNCT